jgi:heme O synthase-like polyprenyltransferase
MHILWYYWIVAVIFDLVFAWICYALAKGKGRSPWLYAILGFFFSIITLIVILVLPAKSSATGAGMQPPPATS